MLIPHHSERGPAAEAAKSSLEGALRNASDELERRIREGDSARAEEYLARHPKLAEDPEQALDLIYVEYVARREMAQAPPKEEFFARFPQWRALLTRQFELDTLLDESPPGSLAADNSTLSRPVADGGASDGRFRDLRLLARGGIGQVMRAVDTELNREVAIKELQPGLAHDDEVRERFLREAEITGTLEHPGIVPVYGLGRDGQGRPFYAMRLVRGQTFQEAIQDFHQRTSGTQQFVGVEFQKLLRRFLHVCETVAYAHSRGIIHRDLKPANILLGPFGETLVVDWGLARATGRDGPQPSATGPSERPERGDSLTTPVAHWSNELTQATGELIGTPAFMSPEQAAGNVREIGPAGDVYSLGATLYMLLTGRAPFIGTEIRKTLEQVAAGKFTQPREINRAIPRTLDAVCRKAMALRPQDRYSSPRNLASDLEHWLADEPVAAVREPLIATLARWGRRHRTHVVAGALTLLLVTVVSLASAILINSERLRADRERIEADRRNARLAFDRAYALTGDHEHGAALLWFARALSHAPPDDTALRRVILTNMDSARHHLLRRRHTFVHPDLVLRWAFSADGRRLLTIERGGTARLWDVETGQVQGHYELPGGRLLATGFEATGAPLVAVHSKDKLLVQRLPAAADEKSESTVAITVTEPLDGATIDSQGRLLAAATQGPRPTKVFVWQIPDGNLLAELDQSSRVNQFVFQPRSDALATVSRDGRVRLWEIQSHRLKHEFRSASGRIERIAFTPDGKRLLAGDTVGFVSCWDTLDGRRLFDAARHTGSVTAVACASDGQFVAAAWDTGLTRVWNLETNRPASEVLRLDRFTRNLAFRPNSRQFMIASQPTDFVLWELPKPDVESVPLNQQQIETVAFSRDGRIAVTGSTAGTARLRDGATGKSFGKVLQHRGPVKSLAIRSDGAVVATASRDGTARLWNTATGEPCTGPLDHRPSPNSIVEIDTVAFSPEGAAIATGDNFGIVRLWDANTGKLIRQMERLEASTRRVSFNPQGNLLAAAFSGPDNSVRMWDVATGELLWKATHRETVRSIAFSPDGRLLISGGNDDVAHIWDVASGQPVGRELVHRGEVFVVGFSPNGQLAMTGGYDLAVRFWAVPSGEPVGEPMRHDGIVLAAAFSADGTRLITGSADRTARLWDVETCLPLSPPLPHRDHVFGLAISPAGDIALAGRLWHLPKPLPDDLRLIDSWAKLATERTLSGGENMEWLDRATLDALAADFQSRTGITWQEWAD